MVSFHGVNLKMMATYDMAIFLSAPAAYNAGDMSYSAPSRSLDKIILRLPEGMREQLQARAVTNGRSMNAEAVAILRASLTGVDDAGVVAMKEEASRLTLEIEAAHRLAQSLSDRRSKVLAALHFIEQTEED
jgi:plasmid stability protein